MTDVAQEDWDQLVGDVNKTTPFMEWRFLASLEESGVLGPRSGWVPQIMVLKRGLRLVAGAPLYVKFHSRGEYVFDFSWAECAHHLGLDYYPKLLVGVPFTPVTGARLLTTRGEDRAVLLRTLASALVSFCQEAGFSSVHVNFAQEDEVNALCSVGFMERNDIQFHWFRRDEKQFDEYLRRFKSKRRNQIKREHRALGTEGLCIKTTRGEALSPADARTAYQLYHSTIDRNPWGCQYLNEDVFLWWFSRFQDRVELVLASDPDGRVVAGALNFSSPTRLYGRYWGCFEDRRFLHFGVCYYHGIQECYDRGLVAFEPGAQGEHKLVRGFEPTLTRSAHLIVDPRLHRAVSDFLVRERSVTQKRRLSLRTCMGTKTTRNELGSSRF